MGHGAGFPAQCGELFMILWYTHKQGTFADEQKNKKGGASQSEADKQAASNLRATAPDFQPQR